MERMKYPMAYIGQVLRMMKALLVAYVMTGFFLLITAGLMYRFELSSAHVPYVIICTPKSQLQNFQHICRCKYQHKQWLVQKIQKQTMSACCLQKRSRQMYPQSLLHFRKLHKHSIQEISGQIKKNPWKQRKVISGKKSRIRETKKRHKESPIQDFRHPSKMK